MIDRSSADLVTLFFQVMAVNTFGLGGVGGRYMLVLLMRLVASLIGDSCSITIGHLNAKDVEIGDAQQPQRYSNGQSKAETDSL